MHSLCPFRKMYTQDWPYGRLLMNYVTLLWVEVGQSCNNHRGVVYAYLCNLIIVRIYTL